MQFERPDMVYRQGLLAERHRERTSNIPLRYQHYWSVHRIVELTEADLSNCGDYCATLDDTGVRVMHDSRRVPGR
jgi:hypothetical protein